MKRARTEVKPPCYIASFDRNVKTIDFETIPQYKELASLPMYPRGLLHYIRNMVEHTIEAIRFVRPLTPSMYLQPYQWLDGVDLVESFVFEGEAELAILCTGKFDDQKRVPNLWEGEPILYSRPLKSGEVINLVAMYQDTFSGRKYQYYVKCNNPVSATVIDYANNKPRFENGTPKLDFLDIESLKNLHADLDKLQFKEYTSNISCSYTEFYSIVEISRQ